MTGSAPTTPGPWLNAEQAAAHLGISVVTFRRECKRGRIRHVKIRHRMIRTRAEWLEAYALEYEVERWS
jgi:predicted site-specific integrase-resolvase